MIQQRRGAVSVKVKRRTFLEISGILATIGFSGWEYILGKVDKAHAAELAAENDNWIPAPCWDNCGGRCFIQANIQNGQVVRIKTDDTHLDSYDNPQQRACVRGWSQHMRIFGPDRLKYPMKRSSWSPENPNGHMRGKDTWERITWDEALNYVADEMKRIKKEYSNEAFYLMEGGDSEKTNLRRLFAAYGGYTGKYGSRSRGCWQKAMKPILGVNQKSHIQNDRMDLLNAKLIILWGNNPAVTQTGTSVQNLIRAKEKGIRFIVVDPIYTETAAMLADQYIPIRPATDTTMLLAMAYVMIKEDSKNTPMIDWDFLNRCTVGFDAEHMHEGADPKENFKDYVLGTYDGIAKTPDWASEICGTPAKLIYELAIEVGRTKPTTILFGWNSARVEKAQHICLAQVTLGAMTGNHGIAGGAFTVSNQEPSTNGGPNLVKAGKKGYEDIENPVKTMLCTNEHWEAILSGQYTAGPDKKEDIDIHMIYSCFSGCLTQTNNINKGIEAYRKVDTVVSHQMYMDTTAMFSDIIFPVTFPWEKEGAVLTGNREMLIWTGKVMEPLYETRDDNWIAAELAKRLNIDEKLVNPLPEKQILFNMVAGASVIKENGNGYEPLVSITKKDIEILKVQGNEQKGRIPILEFKEKGIYQVERKENDNYRYIHNEKFRKDPEKYPLDTRSGKIQIHCQELSDLVTAAGWNKGNPIAVYDPPRAGYEATFADFKKKIKGKYPLQICCIHGRRFTHSSMGNVRWLKEAFPNHVLINPIDAKKRKIKERSVIRIYNSIGSIVRRAKLSERIMPGIIVIYEGPAVEFNKDGYCIAGSPNILTGDYPSGPDIESWQACIGQVELYPESGFKDDINQPERIYF